MTLYDTYNTRIRSSLVSQVNQQFSIPSQSQTFSPFVLCYTPSTLRGRFDCSIRGPAACWCLSVQGLEESRINHDTRDSDGVIY